MPTAADARASWNFPPCDWACEAGQRRRASDRTSREGDDAPNRSAARRSRSPTTSPGCSASTPTSTTSSPSAARTSSTRRRFSTGWSTSTRSTSPPRWPRTAPARDRHGADRLRRRLPRVGLPRGRRPLGPRGRDRPRPGPGPHDPATPRPGRCRRRSATPGACRGGAPSRTARHVGGRPRRPARPRGAGRFEARDHLGAPRLTVRANVEAFLADRARRRRRPRPDPDGGAPPCVRLLLQPHHASSGAAPAGATLATVVEVHNTYGDRHAYLVHPDEQGRARTDKAMYVSPFHGTDGPTSSPSRPDDRLTSHHAGHHDDGARRSARRSPAPSRVPSAARLAAALRGALLIRRTASGCGHALPCTPAPPHHRRKESV